MNAISAILANWKTSVAGAATILTALADILGMFKTGNTATLPADYAAIIAGLGLIFAHDSTPKPTGA